MLEDISTAVENKQITIGVIIDLKKVFDSMESEAYNYIGWKIIFLEKLSMYNIILYHLAD